MHPGVWGPEFWFLLHWSGYTYRDVKQLNERQVESLAQIVELLCQILPCPFCTGHCAAYHAEQPVTTVLHAQPGQAWWEYTVNMHNRVNARSHKSELPFLMAKTQFIQQFEDRAPDCRVLPDEVFMVVYWWLMTAVDVNEGVDEKSESGVRDLLYLLPRLFGHISDERQDEIGALWQNVNLSSREAAVQSMEQRMNQARELLELPPYAVGAMENHFNRFYKARAQVVMAAQKEADADRKPHDATATHASQATPDMRAAVEDTSAATVFTWVFVSVILCIVGLVLWFWVRKYRGPAANDILELGAHNHLQPVS